MTTTKTALLAEWTESERGWGQRPDGFRLYRDRAAYDAHALKMRAVADASPDEYSFVASLQEVGVNDHAAARLAAATDGYLYLDKRSYVEEFLAAPAGSPERDAIFAKLHWQPVAGSAPGPTRRTDLLGRFFGRLKVVPHVPPAPPPAPAPKVVTRVTQYVPLGDAATGPVKWASLRIRILTLRGTWHGEHPDRYPTEEGTAAILPLPTGNSPGAKPGEEITVQLVASGKVEAETRTVVAAGVTHLALVIGGEMRPEPRRS